MTHHAQSKSKDDEPLNDAEDSGWRQYFEDVAGLEQIQLDVERTHQNVPFFGDPAAGALCHQQVRCSIPISTSSPFFW
jgi:hypothetical protein